MPNFEIAHGGVTLPEHVMSYLQAYNVDTMIRFAAHSHVDRSFRDPVHSLESMYTGLAFYLGRLKMQG